MTPFEIILTLIGLALAMATLSFAFIGDNIFFSISESLIIGGGASLAVLALYVSLQSTISAGGLLIVIPIIIGLLSFTRLTKYRWAARYPIAVMSGIGLGIVVGPILKGQILEMAYVTINDLVNFQPDMISSFILLIGTSSIIIYFTYSDRYSGPTHTGNLKLITKIGRIILFAGFGYLYASTFVKEGIDIMSTMLQQSIVRVIRAFQGFYG